MALRMLALSLATIATRVGAQQSGSVPVIGLLITHPPVDDAVVDLFRTGLREYQYEDGKNVKLEVRSALGRLDRVPALAEELVQLPVDIIVVVNEVAARAVMQATREIPIVLVGYINDPVSTGLIESYRRPGGNLTGVFTVDLSLGAKRLEILKEAVPGVSRLAVLWDPAFGKREVADIEDAARSLGLELVAIEVRRAEDFLAALETTKQAKAGAVMLTWSPVFWVYRDQVALIYRNASLPLISATPLSAEAGGLLTYGSDTAYNWARAAHFIERILKGAKAAEMPIEQAMRIKLTVNLKTADALGITIPQSILLRADEVIR
ncbi:MAG: ABC transporter substrate-binding protein [Betaproteobacteria bacterium]|nr:MAG: ABC transporter substrate-binding protein [Betaproteobacteria bacterium]